MTIHVVDTNVLLRAIQQEDRSLRLLARAAMTRLYRRGDVLCVFPQNLIELWNVATRPTKVNGLGLSIAEASSVLRRCEELFEVLPDESLKEDQVRLLIPIRRAE